MPNRKYFFGYYVDSTQITSCTWVEHDGTGIGPKLRFIQKCEITEDECDNISIDDLKAKYPLNEANIPD